MRKQQKKTHILVSFGKTSHAKCHKQIKFVQLFCFVGIVIILFLIFQNTTKQLRNKKKDFMENMSSTHCAFVITNKMVSWILMVNVASVLFIFFHFHFLSISSSL